MKERRPKNRNLLVALLVVVACVVVVGAWQLMGRPTAGSTSASTQATTEQAATDDSTEAADQSSEAASTGDSAPVIVDDGTGDGNVVGVDDDADAAATVVDEDYQQRVDDAQAADEAAGSGTSFEAGKALVSLADGVTVDQVNAMLATMDGVTTKTVTADDISSGYLLVDVAPTSSVEAATAELEESDVVAGAQPNYLYQVMDEQIGTASDLTAATSPTTAIEPLAEAEATSDTTTTTAEKDTAADAATTDAPTTDAPTTDAPTTDTATTDAATEAAATDEAAKTSAQTAAEAASTAATASATTGAEALEATVQAVTINDPYASRQWALSSTKVYQAWATSKANHQVAVAVIDTGALTTHEDLADNIVATYNSYPGGSDATDDYGHGTHVAGIVSAETNNGIGTSGTSYNADLVIVKASNSSGGFTSDSLVRAYQWLIANRSTYDIKVINMSLGGGGTPTSDQDLMKQIDAAEADGILTVCAAGNQAVSQGLYVPYEEWPGDYESVLSVINLQSGTPPTRSSSSNYNVAGTTKDSDCTKDVSAPGTSYYSTYYSSTSTYTYMSGTSMASPCVAGIAALLFAENDSLTPTQAMGTLEATATDLGEAGWDEEYGYGEVDADAAVQSSVIISGDDGVLLGSTLALGASTTKGTPTSWSWSSDDTAVASVGSTGVVTGSRAGTANITATATLSDGSTVSGTRSVTVIDASITGVSLVGKGSSTTYAVSSTPSGLAWSYSSSDPGVAAIGAASGVLTASTVGTVTITATSVAHPTVKLTKQVAVVDASISGAATVTKGGAASYSVTGASGHAWTWSVTSLGGTATIDSSTGRLVAGSTGKVKVTATSTENGSYALTKTVTVFTASVAGSSTVRAGSTTSLSVSATPSVGSWTWSTSDSSIATIDSSGTLTGVSYGTVTVTATLASDTSISITKKVNVLHKSGWSSEDGVVRYYNASGYRVSGCWVVTRTTSPLGGASGYQRYWIGKDGSLAVSRLVTTSEGAGYYAYATSNGYVVRGRYATGNKVYLADNDGRIPNVGWHVSSSYGQGLQRYWIDATTHACVEGYSTDGYGHYTTAAGYVLRGAATCSDGKMRLADNDGRITDGWLVTTAFGQGLQRYWVSGGAVATSRLIGPGAGDASGYYAYATSAGYVVRGTYATGSKVYIADNDGRLPNGGWVVSSAYGQGLQRYWVDGATHACIVGYSTAGWAHYTVPAGYVLRGTYATGNKVYIANNDGLVPSSGWVVSSAYGQGLQRYWVDGTTHACIVGYSTAGWAHYTMPAGYVLRGQYTTSGHTYRANNDGLIY